MTSMMGILGCVCVCVSWLVLVVVWSSYDVCVERKLLDNNFDKYYMMSEPVWLFNITFYIVIKLLQVELFFVFIVVSLQMYVCVHGAVAMVLNTSTQQIVL